MKLSKFMNFWDSWISEIFQSLWFMDLINIDLDKLNHLKYSIRLMNLNQNYPTLVQIGNSILVGSRMLMSNNVQKQLNIVYLRLPQLYSLIPNLDKHLHEKEIQQRLVSACTVWSRTVQVVGTLWNQSHPAFQAKMKKKRYGLPS